MSLFMIAAFLEVALIAVSVVAMYTFIECRGVMDSLSFYISMFCVVTNLAVGSLYLWVVVNHAL